MAILVVEAIKTPFELLKNAYPVLQVAVNALFTKVEVKSEVICCPSGKGEAQFLAKRKSGFIILVLASFHFSSHRHH